MLSSGRRGLHCHWTRPVLPSLHEVKLSGPVAGGLQVVRLRQEGNLALLGMR